MAFRPALLLVFLALACQRTTLSGSVADSLGGGDETAEMDFWDGLAEVRAISNNDALHALLLSLRGESAPDYPGRLALARERGWVSADAQLPANETARAGAVARAVCLEAGIRGGLTMRTFGPSGRYALRELNYRGWLPDMSASQALSGLQLISLLSEAEDHAETKR